MKAKVVSKKNIAENTLLVEFEPEERLIYQPGQYLVLNLIVPKYTDEGGSTRIFSIVSCANEKRVAIATRISDSAFKRSFQELSIGEMVEIKSVGGKFTLPNPDREIVMIAGGIGVTPFISMIRAGLKQDKAYRILLFYSNRTFESSAFLDELRGLAAANERFRLVLTMTREKDWNGEKGRIDEEFLERYVKEPKDALFMIVGPSDMVKDVASLLAGIGVPQEQILSESFGGSK
jgi:ferredoxin-NADP reductase